MAGDPEALALFRAMLIERLTAKRNAAGEMDALRLDWEPFEVVRDLLRRSDCPTTIGGAPQVVKVYQYMNAAPLAVRWGAPGTETPHLLGRPLLGYEQIDRWILDPDTLVSGHPNHSRHGADDAEPESTPDPPPEFMDIDAASDAT
jgi:hypothetical protein